MNDRDAKRPVWVDFDPDRDGAGAVIAALRRGAGHKPGVNTMWEYYTTWDGKAGAEPGPRFVAEHAALFLFAIHQQSKSTKMHQRGVSIGTAAARLKSEDSVGDQGIDALVRRIGGATSQDELIGHLRRLVSMLKIHGIGLDYDRVFEEIWRWASESRRDRICRDWGRDYHRPQQTQTSETTPIDERP